MQIFDKKKKPLTLFLTILLYAILALIMTLTLNSKGIIWGSDDATFHIGRLVSVSHSFQDGNLIPTISTSNFRLIGYAINLFYPYVTIAPIALLFILFNNPITAFYTGMGIYLFISFLISHFVMKKFSQSTLNSVIFSLFYNLSTYMLIEILPRADIAEFIAMMILPICFLGFYNVFFGDFRKWSFLAIGMSALLLTHLLSTVICAFFFIFILILYIIKSNHFISRLKSLLKAIVATVCASAVFLFPFISEITYQPYSQPSPYILKGKVLIKMIQSSFLNSSVQSYDGNTYNIGVFLMAALILGLIFYFKLPTLYQRIYTLAFLSFFMATDIFPWYIFQNTPIKVIQFPFRFLMIATLLTSIIAAKLVEMFITEFNLQKYQVVITTLLAILLCGFWISSAQIAQSKPFINSKYNILTEKQIKSHKFYEDYYEQYSPASAGKHIADTTWNIGKINNHPVVFHPKSKKESIVIKTGEIQKNSVVALPIIRYKNTKLSLNGKNTHFKTSNNGTVQVKMKHKIKHPVFKITYEKDNLIYFSAALSLVTWLYLLYRLKIEKRLQNYELYLLSKINRNTRV
ncbi:hypothetical protein M5C72_03110 [Companilactobacillus allii]|uniref:Membrane protein 6-pyruvoyl-tetrahydropterin synthase-related domain-containing protein n=1 Tax=Companilactobacillus allii TaxID=1847728 RepID=A0A1P8Q2N1_9LACO|nr:hypothetical protein [Companilactobacillus allii]APX72144.1 hypothetical protein BTM29_06035 [Companilactobacillus allii]USQ69241.1 hypothetical protein M5C72_03110 [Companilactobacillus allii]